MIRENTRQRVYKKLGRGDHAEKRFASINPQSCESSCKAPGNKAIHMYSRSISPPPTRRHPPTPKFNRIKPPRINWRANTPSIPTKRGRKRRKRRKRRKKATGTKIMQYSIRENVSGKHWGLCIFEIEMCTRCRWVYKRPLSAAASS